MLQVLLYNNILTDKNLEERLPTMPSFLQARIQRRKRLDSRLNSLAGYLLLRHALETKGQGLEQLRFSPAGKPYVANNMLTFSISHNAGYVGLCWALQGNVGLDIQAYRNFAPIESAFSFFSVAEQKAILQSKDPPHTFIHYWSKKEALIKAGGGRMFDEAAHTNTTMNQCDWKGATYYWSAVETDFNGAIWIASDFLPQKIIVKKCLSI